MRIRLTFEDPLPAYKCWYEVPTSCSTIHDLQRAVRKGFNLDKYCKTTRLDLDGFFLLPASTIAGSLKDGDLLQVMIRKKSDSLPPRHLPVSGGKKRSSEDAGLSNTSDRKASKKMKSTPTNKKPTTPPAKQDNAKKKQSGQGQQKKQPIAQNNKKNQQNTKKAKESNNIKPQKNNEQLPSKANVQGKTNKNNKGSAVSNTNTNNNTKTNTSSQNSKGAETNGTKGPKNNKAVNERRNVHFSPESTSPQKKTAMTDSSSSDSSSSDSPSSDSSSDSSNSDSDSSDDSDSDSSSSESDSNKKDERKSTTARIVPGKGKGATKSRNARRKLLKMKLAEAREEADLGSDSSGTKTLKRQTVAVTGFVETTPATLPLRTSGKTAKTTSQVNEKDPSQDNKKSSPQANGKALAQASTPPKVIMTSVDLKDSGLMTKTTPKRVTRSSQKKPNGMAHQVPEISQPEIGVKQKDSESNKTVATENESDDSSEVGVTHRDYHSLPKSEDNLAIGDVIAFKTLEMGPSYQPIISDFKEATVLSSSITDMTAEVQLARQFRTPVQLDDDGKPILGKFDIYDEEEFERTRRGIVCLDILGLADCRIISKK